MPPRQLGKASALLTFEMEDLVQAITDRLPLLSAHSGRSA